MRFELLDSFTLAGNPSKPNDDAFFCRENAAVVMDGATGLGESLMPGKSDAAWLAMFGARRLMAYAASGASPREAVTAALFDAQTSFEALSKRPPREMWETPLASMMFVAEVANGVEALWFGDCAALVRRPDAAVEVVGEAFEKRQNEARGAAKLAEKHGLSPAAAINRPEYLEALRKARNRANTVEPSWAFGPDVRAADHVCDKHIDAPTGTILLLCSDGFLALASSYGVYDADMLVEAAQTKGLKALAEELRAIEASDADGSKFPRFKTSDDATALLLRLV